MAADIWATDSTALVWQDAPANRYVHQADVEIAGARGETVEAQLVVTTDAQALKSVAVEQVAPILGQSALPAAKVSYAKYLNLPVSRGGPMPFKSAPEPLLAMAAPIPVSANANQSFILEWAIPQDAAAGDYVGQVAIVADGKRTAMQLVIHVYGFTLPLRPARPMVVGIYRHQIAEHLGLPVGDAHVADVVKEVRGDLLSRRIASFVQGGEDPNLADYAKDPRTAVYMTPVPMYDIARGISHLDELAKASKAFADTKLGQSSSAIGMIAPADEVAWEHDADLNKIASVVSAADPNSHVKIALYRSYDRDLAAAVPTQIAHICWVDDRAVAEARAAGIQPWWYTCDTPETPYNPRSYPTVQIGDEPIGLRELSWMQRRYDIEGCLYWNATVWQFLDKGTWKKIDPLQDARTIDFGNGAVLGDGRLYYPTGTAAEPHAVPGLRVLALGKGQDDMQYLSLAEDGANKALAKLRIENDPSVTGALVARAWAATLTPSSVDWPRDPNLLRLNRNQIAQFIETAEQSPLIVPRVEVHGLPGGESGITASGYVEPGSTLTSDGEYPVPVRADGKFVISTRFSFINKRDRLMLTVTKDGKSKTLTWFFYTGQVAGTH